MVDPQDLSVVAETERAVEAARAAGVLTAMDDGAVALLLRLADRMDDPDFPFIEGRMDNVTEGVFLKAARELGLTVAGRVQLPERKDQKAGKLAVLRAGEAKRSTGS